MRPQRTCSEPGCPNVTTTSRCPAHTRPAYATATRYHGDAIYQTARWKRESLAFRKRNPDCAICGQPAQSVDHIDPRADFWEQDNWQALCWPCHRRKTAAQGKRYTCPVTLVCGPPGSGKSTYVAERLYPGDVVCDLDAIVAAITAQPLHTKPVAALPLAWEMRDAFLSRLLRPLQVHHAWVIAGAPKRSERDRYRMAGARVVLLPVPAAECKARADRGPDWRDAIDRWWADYEPD